MTQMNQKIILASTSPFRKSLFERLNLPFETMAPDFDEEDFKKNNCEKNNWDAVRLTQELSIGKAKSLCARFSSRLVDSSITPTIIIGSDQVLDLNGVIFGKPKTAEKAFAQLQQMSGKTHRLVTSMAIVQNQIDNSAQKVIVHTDITTLKMRALSDEEIIRYIDSDKPFDCAGSYKFEKLGISLFDKVETEDATSIVGLPLLVLTQKLRQLGVKLP
jgi:septum formation protein